MRFRIRFAALALAAAAAVLSLTAPRSAAAEDRVIKVGTLKLIHAITPYFYEKFAPPGYKIEISPFESPTDGKNAVVTGSVDFGTYGLAAATLGAAGGRAGGGDRRLCNRGMAVVAGVNSGIATDPGPQGQEGRHLAGLDARGGDPQPPHRGRDVDQGHPDRSACPSATWRRRSRAATSTPMSAPSPGPASASPTAPARSSNTPTRTKVGSLNMVMTTSRDDGRPRSRADPHVPQDPSRRHRIRHGASRRDSDDGDAEARADSANRSRRPCPMSS